MNKRDIVLLVHGLAETSWFMQAIAASLTAAGYDTRLLDFPSTRHSIEEATDLYLAPALRDAADNASRLHIVTHSQAGIMLRYFLARNHIQNLGRIVMIAPGNKDSPTMRVMSYHPLFTPVMGPAGQECASDDRCFACTLPPAIGKETGIIAGCLPLDPVSWFVMHTPNDGKITVDSTRLDGMGDHIVVPASHDTILFHPFTLYQTAHFLQHGKFLHVERPASKKTSEEVSLAV